jgi:hypothetical protein
MLCPSPDGQRARFDGAAFVARLAGSFASDTQPGVDPLVRDLLRHVGGLAGAVFERGLGQGVGVERPSSSRRSCTPTMWDAKVSKRGQLRG